MADEIKIDPGTMGRLAKALTFICGADHAATKALRKAAETGAAADVKLARTQFLKLKPGDRRAAFEMIDQD
jgi:hypothetical protein